MAGRFSVSTVFEGVDRVSRPVKRIQQRVSRFTRSAERGLKRVDRVTDKLVGGIKAIGAAAVLSFGVMSAAMADVTTVGADFEQTIVNAAAKYPGEIRRGTEAFQELADVAKRTGATTEFSASQAAEGLNFLAMAGFDAKQSITALPGLVDLATAAQVDLAMAADVASDSLGAFNLMTKDSAQLGLNLARVNDVIAKTTTTANTTVESLFETIKDGAPVATTAGASLETFAALAGELANSGIKGSQAGTTLKNVFLSLSAPTAQAEKILSRLGVATKDADGNMRDVVAVLDDLGKGLDGLGTADRSGVLEGIFGKIPIAGVNVLLASGTEKLNAYRETLEDASGASSKMAAVMRDTVRGSLNSLNSAVEGVKITIFDTVRGPLKQIIDSTTEWVRANEDLIASKVNDWLTWLINNFDELVSTLKNIGTALLVFGALTAILKTFILVMTAVNLVMALNPVGLIVLGVTALIGLAAALIVAWEPARQFFADLFETISTGLGKVAELASAAASLAGDFFGGEDDEGADGASAAAGAVSSPAERTARSIEESRTTHAAEVTIRDETGRAEMTQRGAATGVGLTLAQTGGF